MRGRFLFILKLLVVFCLRPALLTDAIVDVDLQNPATHVDRRFLSVTVDADVVAKNFSYLNLTSRKFLVLARGLTSNSRNADLYFRLGGGDQDHYFFDPVTDHKDGPRRDILYILNATEVQNVCAFVSSVGWKLVIGLNSLLRHADGSWDPTNAIALMEYAIKVGCVMQFELGNEPDLYESYLNLTVPPSQLAEDFLTLRKVINEVMGKGILLFGPDIATLTRYDYFGQFLAAVKSDVLSAVTFHHYYSSSVNITVQNFTAISYLDSFITYCELAKVIIKKSFKGRSEPPIWIGETSSTYGGGSKQIGQTFAAGFVWLDKLGLAAQFNISVVMRQSIVGASYSLLSSNYDPTPDYWTTLLYKRLVGHIVLNITGFLELGRAIRVYAHCVIPDELGIYKLGDIVLIALNVEDKPVSLSVRGITNVNTFAYILTPASGSLDDKMLKLNGIVLKMVDDNTLPDIHPVQVDLPLQLPAFSYGYIVLNELEAKACL